MKFRIINSFLCLFLLQSVHAIQLMRPLQSILKRSIFSHAHTTVRTLTSTPSNKTKTLNDVKNEIQQDPASFFSPYLKLNDPELAFIVCAGRIKKETGTKTLDVETMLTEVLVKDNLTLAKLHPDKGGQNDLFILVRAIQNILKS